MERRICISVFLTMCVLAANNTSQAQSYAELVQKGKGVSKKKQELSKLQGTIHFLKYSGRACAELEKSAGMLNLQEPFTVEVWFRLGKNPGAMALAGDEAWKNLGEDVVVNRECGWVLRAGNLEGTKRSFDFTLGTARDAKTSDWTRIQTPLLSFDDADAWHHIAVCRSSESIRIFFDGELAVEQSCKGKTFVASPTNVYLGVRRGTFPDRVLHGDIAGFRMSSAVRYEKPFRTPSAFATDAKTLFVLQCDKQDPRALLGSPEPKGSPRKGELAVKWLEAPGQLSAPKADITPIIGKEGRSGYKDVDVATIDGYEKLGGQYGAWVTRRFPTGFERVEFEPGSKDNSISKKNPGMIVKHAESGLPVFLMKSLPTTLPQVAVPFGLDLSRCSVTDSSLIRLAGLTNLTALNLHRFHDGRRISVTDAGLAHLAALKNLTSLDLERDQEADFAVSHRYECD